MRFIDEVEIISVSGRGGDGCVSFRREKFVPRGGPDGGDGGRGGDVIFESTRQRNTLIDFRRNKAYRAPNGEPGRGRQMNGACGKDLLLLVPVGTVIHDATSGEQLADLDTPGCRWVMAGGAGGKGNIHFKTSTRRTPHQSTDGADAIERRLRLELKLLADVGLLGLPNAGKSTLISRISRARPKVAGYPFTTLVPSLGVVSIGDHRSFVVADIPGLIEGAAEGAGLGHRFLKHVERCPVFVHLVAPDADGDSADNWSVLQEELRAYDASLAERTQVVVLSKLDLLQPAQRETEMAALRERSGLEVLGISAVTGEGIQELVHYLGRLLPTPPEDP